MLDYEYTEALTILPLKLLSMWLNSLPWVTAATIIVLSILSVYVRITSPRCRSNRRMDGKTIVITGGESGLGQETTKDLVARGATVIVAGINLEKAYTIRDELAKSPGAIEVYHLDLSSMASVRSFASKLQDRKIDVLLNNAGVADLPQQLTKDGHELTVAVNYLGHFLLVHLLMNNLKATNGRVIMVSSVCHKLVTCEDHLDLNGNLKFCYERPIGTLEIYSAAKAMNILFSNELARRIQGTGVTSNSLHPGTTKTSIFHNVTSRHWFGPIIKFYIFFYGKTVTEGSQTHIHLCVSEEVSGVSGKYFYHCKEIEPSALTKDEALAKKLWEMSERLVQLQPEERTI